MFELYISRPNQSQATAKRGTPKYQDAVISNEQPSSGEAKWVEMYFISSVFACLF